MKAHPFLLAAALAVVAASATAQDAGQRAFQVCSVCHSVGSVGDKVEGPNLKGIVGRKVASSPSFKYSEAMKKFAETHPVWTEELLDEYIKGAEALVPGTAMNNAPAMRNAGARKAIIEYLKAQN